MKKSLTAFILATATLSTFNTLACQVPVFRYALERWQADEYRLQVLHKEPLVKFPEQKHSNISTEYFDADNLTDAQEWSIVGIDQVKSHPSHILMSPDSQKSSRPVLVRQTTEANWKSLTDSPVRTSLKEKLLAGDSAVFLHLLSGDKATDQRTREILESSLAKAQNTIELPEGIINPDEVAKAQAEGEIDFDDVLRSEVPLKIAFSIISLDPTDPAEQDFLKILLQGNSLDQLPERSLIAPIFGRGRCLALMPASKLTEELILDRCQYLCNACACSVKNENPGFDLLMTANWDEKLTDSTAIIEKAIPELTGAGDFIIDSPLTPADTKPINSLPPEEIKRLDALFLSLKILIGLAGIGIIIASFLIYKKSQLR